MWCPRRSHPRMTGRRTTRCGSPPKPWATSPRGLVANPAQRTPTPSSSGPCYCRAHLHQQGALSARRCALLPGGQIQRRRSCSRGDTCLANAGLERLRMARLLRCRSRPSDRLQSPNASHFGPPSGPTRALLRWGRPWSTQASGACRCSIPASPTKAAQHLPGLSAARKPCWWMWANRSTC